MSTLEVPGATLYYEVRGAGPVLLLVPSGSGDAGPYAPVARQLADRYSVVTYDRRGFSRSPLHDRVPSDRLASDTADAVALLDALGAQRAHVFGSSSGAIVALDLLARHADRVATCVAHEPPLASLLPERDEWLAFFDAVIATYRANGQSAAMAMFSAKVLGMASTPPDPELLPPHVREMVERIAANQRFWLEHELRQYPRVVPDLDALDAHRDALVLCGGRDSRDLMPYEPNLLLAARLDLSVVDFPGNHIGYVHQPAEFARALEEVLSIPLGAGDTKL